MKESAHIAYTFIKAHYKQFGIEEEKIGMFDLHIHVPAGAIPKDGPSAGVALFTAMYSAFKSVHIKKKFAMTGEIDLQGLVFPVGGIKEKVLAAKKAGIATVLVPEQNRHNILEIEQYVGSTVKIEYIQHIEEVINIMFGKEKTITVNPSVEESFIVDNALADENMIVQIKEEIVGEEMTDTNFTIS
jgi:ATP-dependent Lon protease